MTTKAIKADTPKPQKALRQPNLKSEAKSTSAEAEALKPKRVKRTEKSVELTFSVERLQFLIVDALEDMKGQSITVFNTEGLSDLFDRVVIASGTSNRQTRALANNVIEKVKKNGGAIYGLEGEDTGEWVLVDCGDIIVHILQPAVRAHFRLEEIWGSEEISLEEVKKLGKPKRRPGPKTKTPLVDSERESSPRRVRR